jgi:NAD(P)-dependent dehydrogenase (short-subunit alcohol dehydrogenase family)
MLLTDKTVLVTGAGRGIGRHIVAAALREGARVIAHVGRSPQASLPTEFQTDNLLPLYANLAHQAELETLWQKGLQWQNRIDVLINNAGIYAASPLHDTDAWNTGWQANIAVNLQAPANLCRLAIAHFNNTREGIIINMASRSSHRGDDAEHLAYGAAKGGLLALTKGIARSCASRGTLAYAIAPAWVRTEMAEAHIAEHGEAAITAELPMREITPPSDVAEMAIFLASGRSRHANGCTIDITGADYVR